MKRLFIILSLLLLSLPEVMAFRTTIDTTFLKIHDLKVNLDEANRNLRIRMDIDPEKYSVGSEREIIFTPILIADDHSDSLLLNNIIIAGRNRWYHYLRDGILDEGDSYIYRAGKKGHAKIDMEIPFKSWMETSTLEMRAVSANCCDAPVLLTGPSDNGYVPIAKIDTRRPELIAEFTPVKPIDSGPVIRTIEGSAFVTFVVNRTELKENYMKNRSELDKILNSINFVRRDTGATITSVHIKGFASPEGPYANNERLAKGRTETLRRYVRDLYHFPDTTVTSSFDAEDWRGLRSYVADSMNFDITNRVGILAIIDGPLGLDDKNTAIQRQFPRDYAVLLKQIYPWLRRSDYKVTYAIKTYTDVDEIRRVIATDPSRLRNVDFYTLAQTYPEGSREYREVYATALEVYPNDPMLNLNAAYMELNNGNLGEAQYYLLKSGRTQEANYAWGILNMRRSDYPEAIRWFSAARDAGYPGMDEVIRSVEEIRDHNPVTYYITPE